MEFVRRIKFSFREKVKWEDVYPHFYLISNCTACMGIGEAGFYYRIGSSNQITASRGNDRLDVLLVFEDLVRYVDKERRKEIYFPVMRVLIRFSIWCIRMTDMGCRKILVERLHRFFRNLPKEYYTALRKGVGENCEKADARQYLLFAAAIRIKPLYFIFNDYLWQEVCEKMVKGLLRAGERVA